MNGRLESNCASITAERNNSPAESELDLDLRYIQNVLTDYDSQYLQTSESD